MVEQPILQVRPRNAADSLWPELEAILKEAWNSAPAGENRIITRYTDSSANLRTLLKKIIVRAKLKPWPKLFQYLRASRENELIDRGVPAHVAATWIGHSVKVQKKSYLQVDAMAEAISEPASQSAD